MQQELNISILLYRIYRQFYVLFEALEGLFLKCKVRIVVLRVVCEGLVLTRGDPNNRFFEVELIGLDALS